MTRIALLSMQRRLGMEKSALRTSESVNVGDLGDELISR